MGCLLKRRKLQIDTFDKLEEYLQNEDNYYHELLEELNNMESIQDHSCLAEKYEISTHLNMLQDFIFYLKNQENFEDDKKQQDKFLDEIVDILEHYEIAKKESFKDAELNKKFQDKVDFIVINEKKTEK